MPESQEHIDIINKIFEWYIQGEGFRVIANKVDKAGFTSKKKRADGTYAPIGKHGIKGIITNERYMGYVQVPIRSGNEGIGKIERKEGNYKLVKTDKIVPIVSEETFKKAYDIWNNKPLTKDNRGKKPRSSKYSKYLICANCKCHFIKAEGHNGKSLYVCSHKRNVGAAICKMPYLTEQFLDEQLETLAKGVLVQDDRARLQSLVDKIKHFKLMYIYDYAHTDNTQKLQQLKEQIAEKERKFNAVMDMVGELDKDVIKRQSERYNKELTELEAELEELEATDDKFKFHIGVCDDFIKRANELTLPAKYTAENILEHTTYIEVMQLPNQTDRIQSKTNNVELEVITKASGLIASLDNDFMDSIGEYPACLSEFYFSDDIESLEQWYANSGFVF